jgi:hypothetical protein
MSAIEVLAKRYLDEISAILPLPCIAVFAIGVCASSLSIPEHGSLWLSLLASRYGRFWYFRDILFGLPIWQLLAIIVASLSGPFLAKILAKKMIALGARAAGIQMKSVYERAVEVAKRGDFSKIELDAARQWRVMRFSQVWGLFKISSFFLSLASLSIFLFAIATDWFGLLIFLLSAIGGLCFIFLFSKKYFAAYLPERILFDASVGLLDPRFGEDLQTKEAQ